MAGKIQILKIKNFITDRNLQIYKDKKIPDKIKQE